ncbi:MAG: Rrf2 family transcriptional regulator [Candidatus Heimdallarchaeaceae archaeon]
MKLSQAAQTAIEILNALKRANGHTVSISTIADTINSSKYWVTKIVQMLRKRGILNTTLGQSGGIQSTGETTLYEIMDSVDDAILRDFPETSRIKPFDEFRELNNHVIETLKKIKV